jgi:predicted protein tyrosine phosphatase
MIVKILNRREIKAYQETENYAVISISCSNDPGVELSAPSNLRGLLRIQFDDISQPVTDEKTGRVYAHFTPELAKHIINFVNAMLNKVNIIVCQCDAGISRSAGVAVGLSALLCINEDQLFNSGRYIPNTLVYKTIKQELTKMQKANGF